MANAVQIINVDVLKCNGHEVLIKNTSLAVAASDSSTVHNSATGIELLQADAF